MSASTRLLSCNPYAGRDFDNRLTDDFGTIPVLLPDQITRACRYVAGMATDVGDARTLLAMLGLYDGPMPTVVQEAARHLLRGKR